MTYYNEIDPYAAQWLRNLIAAGHLPGGDVDDRSIADVEPDDLVGYTQCHFFAGIGGWPLALRLAGWPETREVWTGSPPCQPFSAAGQRNGQEDKRHLWPEFFRLIRERRPATLFGEQVAAAIGFDWLDHVQVDMETEGYAFGKIVLPACSVGAPHKRERLWFLAESNNERLNRERILLRETENENPKTSWRGEIVGLADTDGDRRKSFENKHTISVQCSLSGASEPEQKPSLDSSGLRAMADMPSHRLQKPKRQDGKQNTGGQKQGWLDTAGIGGNCRFWQDADWLYCRDGKWRPVEPGTFPLAHGVSNRVGRLRAYGNAIVPQVAAEVVKAFLECRP